MPDPPQESLATEPGLDSDTATVRQRDEALELPAGSTVGRYIVLEVLGSGAMGTVYAAYDPGLDRKIALKLLRGGRDPQDTTRGQARLRREAQALARLSHPNVVAVHEVDTFRGHVFIAMEFVDGQTLTAWLEDGTKTWREIVDVVAEAGRGLAHAHAASTVHRDFKPDNVLIGRDGRTRVADFGLAQPGDSSLSGRDLDLVANSDKAIDDIDLSRTKGVVGTPAYMPPEQAFKMDVDARADQFSYCVTLYEALYGERPFAGRDPRQLIVEISKGRVRRPSPGRRVPTWLRKVLVRGLAADPSARYADMNALLGALDWRAHRRKGAMLIAPALIAGALGATYLLGGGDETDVCPIPLTEIEGVWDPGRKQQVADALAATGVPVAADSIEVVTRTLDAYVAELQAGRHQACISVRVHGEHSERALDLWMACLQRAERRVQTATELLISADSDVVYEAPDLVDFSSPPSACADVDSLLNTVLPPAPEIADQVAEALALLDDSVARRLAGRVDEGQGLREQAEAIAEVTDYPPLLAALRREQAKVAVARDDLPGAEALLAGSFANAIAGRDFRRMAQAASQMLIVIDDDLDRAADADRWYATGVAALDALGGDDSVAAALETNRGNQLRNLGRLEDAVAAHQKVAAIYERQYPPGHHKHGHVLYNLATIALVRGDYDEARDLMARVDPLWSDYYLPGHPIRVLLAQGLGSVEARTGHYEQAIVWLSQAVDQVEHRKGQSLDLATQLNNRGSTYVNAGRFDDARRDFEQALEIIDTLRPGLNRTRLYTVGNMPLLELGLGDLEAARRWMAELRELLDAVYDGPHLDIVTALIIDAEIGRYAGDYDKVARLATESLAVLDELELVDHPMVVEALFLRAQARAELGDPKAAREDLTAMDAHLGKTSLRPDQLHWIDFVRAVVAWPDPSARPLAEKARRALGRLGPGHRLARDAIDAWLASHPAR